MGNLKNEPLATIFDPRTVRMELGKLLRESQLVRRLLRLSEAVAREQRSASSREVTARG